MKTRIATMISIAGVLVAGSAAALVNTQVLSGSAAPSPLSIDAAPQTSQSTLPAPTLSGVSTTVAAVTPRTTPVLAPAATQAVYAIGTSGTVTLDTAGDVLTIVDVTPADGWFITKSEREDATNVEVKFQSGSVEVEFHANLLFGVVTTSVESDDESSTSDSVDDNSARHGGDDDGHGSDDD